MMIDAKTHVPTEHAIYLLERYTGKSKADWFDILDEDANLEPCDRQIPFFQTSETRFYAIEDIFKVISDIDVAEHVDDLAVETGNIRRAQFLPSARICFDHSKRSGSACVELIIANRGSTGLRLTPQEARLLGRLLINEADLVDILNDEESEYVAGNQSEQDAANALLIDAGFVTPSAFATIGKEGE